MRVASVIVLDNAGFRTLDFVVPSREIFGQTSITILYHCFHEIEISNMFSHVDS